MHQLGYEHYVIQGGDFGSHTARYMGAAYPESVKSTLCNLYGVTTNDTDLVRYASGQTTVEESSYIEFLQQNEPFTKTFWGIEAMVPLQMGILLGDSPVGNTLWPYFGMRGLTPGYNWSIEELITWGMMLYIQGPYGNVRIYSELERVSARLYLRYDSVLTANIGGNIGLCFPICSRTRRSIAVLWRRLVWCSTRLVCTIWQRDIFLAEGCLRTRGSFSRDC